jgi:hypothetical protein
LAVHARDHCEPAEIAFEYSAFAVDGRPDLSMVVYNPATATDGDKIASLVGSVSAAGVIERLESVGASG